MSGMEGQADGGRDVRGYVAVAEEEPEWVCGTGEQVVRVLYFILLARIYQRGEEGGGVGGWGGYNQSIILIYGSISNLLILFSTASAIALDICIVFMLYVHLC